MDFLGLKAPSSCYSPITLDPHISRFPGVILVTTDMTLSVYFKGQNWFFSLFPIFWLCNLGQVS